MGVVYIWEHSPLSIFLDRKLSLGDDVRVIHGVRNRQGHRCSCLQRSKLSISKALRRHGLEGPGLDKGCNDQVQHKAHDEEIEDLRKILGLDQLADSGLQAHSLQFTTEKKYVRAYLDEVRLNFRILSLISS